MATTISRGETLLLLLHRGSAEQAQGVHHMVARLREDWARLRAEAEHLKAEARREEKEGERFTSLCSGLLVWLAEVERRLEGAVEDALAREAVLREMEGRKEELERTNSLGLELREKGLMEGLEASLTSCNYRWSAARAECRGSKASSPGVKEGRVEAAEITARMGRVGASSPLLLLTPTHLLTSSPPHPYTPPHLLTPSPWPGAGGDRGGGDPAADHRAAGPQVRGPAGAGADACKGEGCTTHPHLLTPSSLSYSR